MADASNLILPAPFDVQAFGGVTGFTTLNMPNQNDAIGCVFTSQVADTITDIGFRMGVTTGATPALGHTIGGANITTSGLPDLASLLSTGTTFTTSTDSTWQWVSLGANTFALTLGQDFALYMLRNAANDASNKVTAASKVEFTSAVNTRSGKPMCCTAAAGVWVKTGTVTGLPVFAIKTSTSVYGWPIQSFTQSNTFGNTVEAGMLFSVPTSFCATFKLAGIRLVGTSASAAKTYVASLYTLNGSRVPQSTIPTAATASLDSDGWAVVNNAARSTELYFTTQPTLTAGTSYAIGLATTTAADGSLNSITVSAVGDWAAYRGGSLTSYSTRTVAAYPPGTDATAFAAGTTTQRPLIELIFSDITAPAGGTGGGIRIAGHGGLAA